MSDLAQIQQWMQQALVFPHDTEDSLIAQQVLPSANITAKQSLAIYQRSYYSRLLSCMQEQFPATYYCLGEQAFNYMAGDFLRAYPSESYTLYELGRRFVNYMQQTRPDKEAEQKELWIEFMVELAQFERLAFKLFDAEGDEGRILTDKSFVGEVALQRGVRLHQSKFAVAHYYCLVRDGLEPKLPPLQSSFVALVRVDYTTSLRILSAIEFEFLQLCQHGSSIEQALHICEKKFEIEIQSQWQQWRASWLEMGFFIKA